MNRLIRTTVFYVIICIAILVSHRLSHADMCNPGLDLLVYAAGAILTIASFARSQIKLIKDDKISRLNHYINVGGLIAVGILFYVG